MAANLLEQFLLAVGTVKATGSGTGETSYYPALSNLLDAVGGSLKPKVRCVIQLKNQGAGNPDGGFFTADQFDRKTGNPKQPTAPARGVLEVKAPAEAVDVTTATAQVAKYWDRYKLVLVTNLRDWLLLGERGGARVELERYTLAPGEVQFWQLTANPAAAETTHGAPFVDFLKRVLRHNAPLAEPRDLAWLLASYAREARHRIEQADPKALDQLSALKSSLEKALGASFDKEQGEHFFRSTLVQTLFYGVFSAWVLRHEQGKSGAFDWKTAAHDLHVPMISALFEQLSQPSKLNSLDLMPVLDWAGDALNRVNQAAFFSKFEAARSVQYFYEPFLEAFDPELRKQLGVWYTPEEIVRYQVARVDEALRNELGLADGLADPRVLVLDPCCGTGTYLVEVLRVIAEKLKAHGADAVAAHELKLAATTRLFGFELLPAPYVVAHLQLGLLLRHMGVALADDERASVYLTNALTGWEPPKNPKVALPFPEFGAERDAADAVKQTQQILVVLGNPPYNAFSGVALSEEQDLIAPYKAGLARTWGIRKFNLDDLYVRFIRLAERRIAEQGGRGVVCYITNFSFVRESSFVVMREHLLGNFDAIRVDNLNGDSRETGKLTPDGEPDPSVFSTSYNREGIRKGTAITTLVKRGRKHDSGAADTHSGMQAEVRYRDWWGAGKREALLESLDDPQRDSHYAPANPSASNRFSLKPDTIAVAYAAWPKLPELAGHAPINGLMEKRGGALIDISRTALAQRMQAYFDQGKEDSEVQALHAGLLDDAAGFNAAKVRGKAILTESFSDARVVRYAVRPFDTRYGYFTSVPSLWNRARPTLWAQHEAGNRYLMSRPAAVSSPEGAPIMFTRGLGDNDAMRGHAYYVPLAWHAPAPTDPKLQPGLFAQSGDSIVSANLSATARAYLAALDAGDPVVDSEVVDLIWLHALAIGYSPAYLTEHADGIRQDWPRIPLPATRDALLASAQLGRAVAALLDTESPLPGVTSGAIRAELQPVAVISRKGGGALQAQEFRLTAGWGHAGKAGAIMPGKGRVEARAAGADELAPQLAEAQASARTLDVFLNGTAYWSNVPLPVWEFTIGGYQVMKKWLSYREFELLGRPLSLDEIKEVTAMARRLAALVMLRPALDDNYRAVTATTYDWPG